ncbi:hypothetical protein SUDANB176_06308 [Streptomyces sp. enrichment culture]
MPDPGTRSPDREGHDGANRNPARQMIAATTFESGWKVKTVN